MRDSLLKFLTNIHKKYSNTFYGLGIKILELFEVISVETN